jgi:hypothetical protein
MHRNRRLLAAVARTVAAALTLSVAAAGLPAAAQDATDSTASVPSPLRQSIDRAVAAAGAVAPSDAVASAALSAAERADVVQRAERLKSDPVAGQARGGGGTFKTIVALVGIAASVWGTWYMIKSMREQQDRAQGHLRP